MFPSSSASSWTSMCFTGSRYFSMYIRPSPKAFSASLEAVWKARSMSSGRSTRRMPLPPPPALALMSTG